MKPIFGLAIVCLIASLVSIVVAIERYNTNANNVRAMNSMVGSSGISGFPGMGSNPLASGNLQPATPTATKYGIFFAILFAGGAIACVVIGRKPEA